MKTRLGCIILCLALPLVSRAVIVEIGVEGLVDEVLTTGPYGLDGSVQIGTAMIGSFIYDSEAQNMGEPGGNACYPLISITMSIGNYTFYHDLGVVEPSTFNIYGQPRYIVGSDAPRFDGTIMVNGTPAQFEDVVWAMAGFDVMNTYSSHTEYFQTTDLPTAETFPPFWAFDIERTFGGGFNDGVHYFGMRGELTDVFVVPEPGTVALLSLGGLVAIRRRRSR